MKPTLQQTEILKSYLADILKYRETIDEVYDHVLSAVEVKPENISFQDAVNHILNDDFGGGNGLVKMEKQHLRNATQKGFIQVFSYIKSDFEYPNVLYTLLLFVNCYYVTVNLVLDSSTIAVLPLVIILFVCVLKLSRTFFIGYYKRDTRTSVQDRVLTRMYSVINFSALYFVMLRTMIPGVYKFIFVEYPIIFTTILTAYLLCIYSIIRILINEFKPIYTQ
ncbi:MAG: hypothetical protein EOP42_11320 [Sphingobacteriaceae bacterium]|nr:MAG: hypothetical protein EOP42_11320 [Sphingobacteriaceae bacterium]